MTESQSASEKAQVQQQDDADLSSKVEALKVSDDKVQRPRDKRNTPRKDNARKDGGEGGEGGDGDVFHEPRVRNEHDNRFNYPNRTFSRDNRPRERDSNWGGGRGRGGRHDDREFGGYARGRYFFIIFIIL